MKRSFAAALTTILALWTSLGAIGCGSDGSGADMAPADAGWDADASTDEEAQPEVGIDADMPDSAEPVDAAADQVEDTMGDHDEGDASQSSTVTILSLNLHCLKVEGTTFATNTERFAAIAQAVALEHVRAIAVQEACETPNANAMNLLLAALESATGASWQKAWQATHIAWEGTADEAIEGVGLFVRGALTDVRPIVYRAPGALARAALSAVLPPELGGVRLISTHLDYSDNAARAAQARETASVGLTMTDPSLAVVVAGDFNAPVGQPAHAAMLGYGFRDLSASLDPSRIDHVFAHRGAGLELVEAKTVFDGTDYPIVSDHHGVLVRAKSVPADAVTRTRIRVHASGPDWLAVRGDQAPLTWQEGFPAWEGTSEWSLVLTEIGAGVPFEFKCLQGDAAWETGDNHVAAGGDTIDVTPAF